MATLNIGDEVPDFEIPAVTGNIKTQFKLSDYRGKKNVVLAFYPADWTPVCASQLPAINGDLERFGAYDAEVIGISVDSIPSHTAWQKKEIGTLGISPWAAIFILTGMSLRSLGFCATAIRSRASTNAQFLSSTRRANSRLARSIPSDRFPVTMKSSRHCGSCNPQSLVCETWHANKTRRACALLKSYSPQELFTVQGAALSIRIYRAPPRTFPR